MASPRGRIYLVRGVDEGQAGISAEFVKHLDQCLGCLACQTACPSGVAYGHLLEAARTQIERRFDRPRGDRRWRTMILRLFPHPERLGPAVAALYWCQRLGVSQAVRNLGLLSLVSPRLASLEALLPEVPPPGERAPLPPETRAEGTRRGRVGILTGCVQRLLLPQVNRATARVLASAGYDGVAPPGQGCCGALHLHGGHREEGRRLAKGIMEIFEQAAVDMVAANAAGCGAAMKAYGHLLEGENGWRSRAEAFSAKVRDVSQILAAVPWDGRLKPVPLTVTYHEACHLAHAQRIRQEPRTLLGRIPELKLVELPESDLCCGSAGMYNLLEPDLAGQLLHRKMERIRETGASVVAAANIGCLLQIARGFRQAGLPIRSVHPVELLDWSLHGMPAGQGTLTSDPSRRDRELSGSHSH
jgi:glycolate oxidase iron-sulfur subunit